MGSKLRLRKKRKPIPDVTSIDFSPRLRERIEALQEDQDTVMEKQVAISAVLKLKEDDSVLFSIEHNPEAYLAAEELAFEMFDVITESSKKFKNLSMEQKFYWECMLEYTQSYLNYLDKLNEQKSKELDAQELDGLDELDYWV